jgi:hypothetical protein
MADDIEVFTHFAAEAFTIAPKGAYCQFPHGNNPSLRAHWQAESLPSCDSATIMID